MLSRGSEVGDDDKGHAGLGRHGLKQIFKRFHASGGGADADYGKWLIHRLSQQGLKGKRVCLR
jgi:hypothetical protein